MAKTVFDLVTATLQTVTLEDIALEAGIAHQTLRQYRQSPGSKGYRNASPEVQMHLYKAVITAANRQARHFANLAEKATKQAALRA